MSDLEARREARRRRILENAENRLKKISSKDDNFEEKLPQTKSSFSKARATTNILKSTTETGTSAKISVPVKVDDSSHSHDKKRVGFDPVTDLRTIYQNPSIDDSDSIAEVEFQNFDERNSLFRDWIIVLLAIIVRYLFLVCEQYPKLISRDFLFKYHINKIFMPFFLFEITEYAFFKPFIPQSGLLDMLFVLNLGMRVENIQKIVVISRIMVRIMQDMMVYFFAFVSFDQVIVFITQERI